MKPKKRKAQKEFLKDADVVSYPLLLILGNAFGDPGYVADFLGGVC